MKRIIPLIIMCTLLCPVWAKEYLIFNHPGGDRGFFNVMDILFGNIAKFNPIDHDGATIDLEKRGFNYEPSRGDNYWTYYFEPVNIGEKKNDSKIRKVGSLGKRNDYWYLERTLSRQDVHRLIETHLVILPHIQAELQPFADRFKEADHVLGIHYRGTDRMAERKKKTSHQDMINQIESVLASWEGTYLIFVATDEQAFLDLMKKRYGAHVLCVEEAERSRTNKSFHQHPKSPYKSGEEALVDCLLLSKTNLLLRTESCLSRWSGYFNPDLPSYNMELEKFE